MGAEKTDERGPIWVYAIEYPDGRLVLIDSAYPQRTEADPGDYPGKFAAKLLDLEMGVPMVTQLAEAGLGPVERIVLTHLHDDHAAGVEDFPEAMLWADRADWLYADRKRALHGIDPEPFAGREFRHPTYSHGPWGPFDSHTDLFGDGSILLFPAPGHTPGSMMVLVNSPEHSWLFLGDVSWTDDGWTDGVRPKGALARTLVEADWRENMDSLYRVQSLVGMEDLTIISGHEPANIDRFPEWPKPW